MNSHANKPQENKSRSFVKNFIEKQSGGEPVFQFVNNLPRTTVQSRLQEIANNSPRVHQLKAIKETVNNGNDNVVIQRELAKDRLNVVGENHPESDPRRDREKAYAEKIIGSGAGYWQEDEFAVKEEEDFGDPIHLRLADLLNRVEKYFNDLQPHFLTIELETDITKNEKILKQLQKAMQNGMTLYFSRLIGEIVKILNLNKNGKYPLTGQMEIGAFKSWAKNTLALKRSLAAEIDTIKKYFEKDIKSRDIKQLNNLGGTLFENCTNIIIYASESINKDLQGQTDITKQRSRSMNKVAGEESKKNGIWKIGQQHVDDIKGEYDTSKLTYKLVDRELNLIMI